jgi:hypothetical protein
VPPDAKVVPGLHAANPASAAPHRLRRHGGAERIADCNDSKAPAAARRFYSQPSIIERRTE